jgi:hypothetical protein
MVPRSRILETDIEHMDIIAKGDLQPFLQSETWDYDPSRGFIHTIVLEGASRDRMQAWQNAYVRSGIPCRRVDVKGGKSTLSIEDNTIQYTLDIWEIVGNEESRDGLSHPIVLAQCTDAQVFTMRNNLENNMAPEDAFADETLSTLSAQVRRFYAMQKRGATEYRRGQYVLRHRTNAPGGWQENVDDWGVGCVYTTAQLLSEVRSSYYWTKPLPDRMAYKISHIPYPNYVDFYQWGWLKDLSTESTTAYNRIDIQTNYTLEQWPNDYYPAY